MHGGWMHLGGNMLYLWVFGDNVEDALGHFKFLVFYLACGAAGALAHTAMMADSGTPLIGASAGVGTRQTPAAEGNIGGKFVLIQFI